VYNLIVFGGIRMYYIIDRFEGNIAVCEESTTRKMVNIHISRIKDCAKEGDFIIYQDGEYIIDYERTKKEREEISNQYSDLWE